MTTSKSLSFLRGAAFGGCAFLVTFCTIHRGRHPVSEQPGAMGAAQSGGEATEAPQGTRYRDWLDELQMCDVGQVRRGPRLALPLALSCGARRRAAITTPGWCSAMWPGRGVGPATR